MKMFRTTKQKNGGYTVMEMLIAVFIITLIGIVAVNFQLNIFSLNRLSNDNLLAQEDARQALKILTAEIRTMEPAETGAYPIAVVATSSLTFYSDIDGDSTVEKIRYYLDGTTLKKGTVKPAGSPLSYNQGETLISLVHDVANSPASPIFEYYDENYDGSSAPLAEPVNIPDIRLIKASLTIDDDPAKAPAALYLTTQVSIRNLKNNL